MTCFYPCVVEMYRNKWNFKCNDVVELAGALFWSGIFLTVDRPHQVWSVYTCSPPHVAGNKMSGL